MKFEIGGGDPKTPNNEQDEADDETWECVWKCHTAAPVHHMAFSPDGTLFATSGKSDRLVKVWYENKHRKLLIDGMLRATAYGDSKLLAMIAWKKFKSIFTEH